jgi:hypothetical protein
MELRSMYVNRPINTTIGPQQYNRCTVSGAKPQPQPSTRGHHTVWNPRTLELQAISTEIGQQ